VKAIFIIFLLSTVHSCKNNVKEQRSFAAEKDSVTKIESKILKKFGAFDEDFLSIYEDSGRISYVKSFGYLCDSDLLRNYKYDLTFIIATDTTTLIKKNFIVSFDCYVDNSDAKKAYSLLQGIFTSKINTTGISSGDQCGALIKTGDMRIFFYIKII